MPDAVTPAPEQEDDGHLPFRADKNALISFGDAGKAPVLNYNVPQPAEYNGRHYLELKPNRNAWKEVAKLRVDPFDVSDSILDVRDAVERVKRTALEAEMDVRGLLASDPTALAAIAERLKGLGIGGGTGGQDDVFITQDADVGLAERIDSGEKVVVRKSFGGASQFAFVKPGPVPKPRLSIITSVRMSSYLGDYGAARTIGTFSLLPGESHEISIKSFKRSKTTRSESASILDSHDTTTESEFGEDLMNESSARSKEESSFSAKVSVQGSASWGFGSVSASASASTSSSSEREEFAKSVASTTQRHAAKAASKRQMEVNTTSNEETEETEERSITRTIQNINVGRTLNFVFRQMVQRYVTVLWITDVRIGYHNDDPDSYREYALSDVEAFLDELIEPQARDDVREMIHDALFYNFDWRGHHRPLVEEVKFAASGTEAPLIQSSNAPEAYWRFRQHRTELNGVDDGANVTVPGSVLAVVGSTLPTEGVIAEALLGQGNALDAYSLGLQSEAVRTKIAENDMREGDMRVDAAMLKAAEAGDNKAVHLLTKAFAAPADDDAADDSDE